MARPDRSSEELLRIVGEEREAHTPEDVAAAEAELTQRLGGTRAQAHRRLGYGGAFNLALGLFLVAAATYILIWRGLSLLREEAAVPGLGEEAALCIPLAIMFSVGVALAIAGLAVLRRMNWALKKARFIPFVRSADVALLAAAPALEDLLDTVGPGRTAQEPERVAAAECELRERLARAHEDWIRRVRRWGLAAIVLGLYLFVCSANVLLMMTRMGLWGAEAHPVVGRGVASILNFWLGFLIVVTSLCFSPGLVACGLGLRKRREWARRTLIWILWMWFAFATALAPLMAGWMLMTGAQARDFLIMLALAPLVAAFWVAVFWRISKALASVATREVCRPSQGEQGPEAPRKFRRRMLLAAAVAIMVVLLAPLVAYGIWWRNSAAALRAEFQQLRQSGAVLNLREWKPPLPSAEDNAADLLRKAAAQMERAEGRIRDSGSLRPEMPGGEELEDWVDLLELKAWTPAQAAYAQRVLSHHAEALESLRMASAMPHADFDWDYSELVPILDGLQQLRRGVRLMCLSALSAQREQNHAQAVADIATALRLARFPDGDPFLVVHIGRTFCATLAARCCEALLQTAEIPAGLLVGLDRPLGGAGRGLDPARALACERAQLRAACHIRLSCSRCTRAAPNPMPTARRFWTRCGLRSPFAATRPTGAGRRRDSTIWCRTTSRNSLAIRSRAVTCS